MFIKNEVQKQFFTSVALIRGLSDRHIEAGTWHKGKDGWRCEWEIRSPGNPAKTRGFHTQLDEGPETP